MQAIHDTLALGTPGLFRAVSIVAQLALVHSAGARDGSQGSVLAADLEQGGGVQIPLELVVPLGKPFGNLLVLILKQPLNVEAEGLGNCFL